MKRSFVCALVLLFGLVGQAFAGAATDVVKAKQTALRDLLGATAPDAAKLAAIYDQLLDDPALAAAALGSEWAPRSAAEQAQFTDLFKQLVRRSYQRDLEARLRDDITYVGETTAAGTTLVKTRIKPKAPGGTAVDIAFKMVKTGGAWRVQDIVTGSISLVAAYRGQFTKIIKKDGFPVLIQKLKDKLAKGDV